MSEQETGYVVWSRRDSIQYRAEEIAAQETGRDYCDLLPGEQEFFCGIAEYEG